MKRHGFEKKLGRENKLVGFGTAALKFAEDDDAEEGSFSGYGAIFGNVDSYGDVIMKGAFRETLKEAKKSGIWPAMLLQHGGYAPDDMTPIGIWTKVEEDDKGLYVEGKLAIETSRGKDVYALMKMKPRPALSGLSIGYRAKEFEYGTKPTEPRRTLKKVELLEISPVTFAANPKASIGAVKGREITERQFEEWLKREAGFTSSEAKTIISSGFKALKGMRDAAPSEAGIADAFQRAARMFRAG